VAEEKPATPGAAGFSKIFDVLIDWITVLAFALAD